MTITAAIALFFVIWWLVLFAVLPFGVRSQVEEGKVVPGSEPGAPVTTRMGRVVAITTAVTAVVFAVVWFVYVENVLGLPILDGLIPR